MRKLLIISVSVLLTIMVACESFQENNPPEPLDISVYGLNGPTSMGMIKLFEDNPSLGENVQTSYSNVAQPDVVVSKLLNGEIDIAAIPTNLASIIYNKTEGDYKVIAVNTLGVLYLMTNERINISTIEDLRGKTIGSSGLGATPEYVFKHVLSEHGINPQTDIQLDYSLSHAELAQGLIAGEVEMALLPQPFVTMVTMASDAIIAISLQKEWSKIEASDLAMGCIVAKTELIESRPEIIDNFLQQLEGSVNWVNNNPVDAGVLIEKFDVLPKAKMAELAIPHSNIVFIEGKEAKFQMEGILKVLYDFNPKSIGGKLPDEKLYYKK